MRITLELNKNQKYIIIACLEAEKKAFEKAGILACTQDIIDIENVIRQINEAKN